MDHNMRKNSYKIVLSRTWRTEGGNFLLGTRRGKVSCFMVDVPLSSIIAGSVLTGHVIRRRRDLTDWQRREGSDCVFFSTTPRQQLELSLAPQGTQRIKRLIRVFTVVRFLKGCHHHGSKWCCSENIPGFPWASREHPMFFALDFNVNYTIKLTFHNKGNQEWYYER